MNIFTENFNNRELAIIIWTLVFLVYTLSKSKFRTTAFTILKTFFQKIFVILVISMFLYIVIFLICLYKINLWNTNFTKDTVIWLLGTALILLMNVNKATQEHNYFKNLLLNNLKFILVFEFVINLYTFNIWIEIISIPIFIAFGASLALADINKEHKPVKKPIEYMMGIYGIVVLIFTVYNIIVDLEKFATMNNIFSFLLPPLLTFIYIPFLYSFALFITYQTLFVRLDILLDKEKSLIKYIKIEIFKLCLLNLGKLKRLSKESIQEFNRYDDKKDVGKLIQQFKFNINK